MRNAQKLTAFHQDGCFGNKFFLLMKLITPVLLVFLLQVAVFANGQGRLTIKIKNLELGKAITLIEQKSDYRFVYNNNLVPVQKKITASFHEAELQEVMDKLLEGTKLTFKLTETNLVVIYQRENVLLADIKVTGKITDENGNPLSGATVQVKGQGTGTSTSTTGDYELTVPDDAVLVISYVGFETREIAVGGRTVINLSLKTSVKVSDQVIVIGYGTARKRDLTGASTNIKGSEIANIPTTTATQAIQGKAAGVQITGSSAPGSAPTVRIRGTGSSIDLPGAAEPLYVVDGIITNDIRNLNSADIQSIDILKDPSSAAIYGVRAGNGVVIITTKAGRKGKMSINYDAFVGAKLMVNKVAMAGPGNYAVYINDATDAFTVTAGNVTGKTDWYDAITRIGILQNHNLSLSGGSDKGTYFFSGAYLKEQGLLLGNDYERYTLRSNNEYFLTSKLKIGNNISLSKYTSENKPYSTFTDAYNAAPIYDAVKPDGLYGYTQLENVGNPLAKLDLTRDRSWGTRIQGNINGEYKILPNLLFRTSIGLDAGFNNGRVYSGKDSVSPIQYTTKSNLSITKSDEYNWVWDNTLTYNKKFNTVHDVKILVGHTAERYDGNGLNASRDNVPAQEQYWNLGNGDPSTTANNSYSIENYGRRESYLGRINYSYDSRYLATISYRRDGSSKFPSKNRWANSGSVGLGWIITDEAFMQDQKTFKNLKLRASWGLLGNDLIAPGNFVELYQKGFNAVFGQPGVLQQGTSLVDLKDLDLKWEIVRGIDIGIEFEMLDGRLSGEIDYYNKLTKDALFWFPLPGVLGDDDNRKLTNAADISNKGVELSLRWNKKVSEKLSYNIGGNVTYNKNNVEKIAKGKTTNYGSLNNGTTAIKLAVDQPIGSFWVYKTDGILQTANEITKANAFPFSEPGDWRIVDTNNDGIIDDKDRVFVGSYQPKLYFGLNSNVLWKNFDFGIDIYGNAGNKVYNGKKSVRGFGNNNIETDLVVNRWTPSNPTNDYRRAFDKTPQVTDDYVESGTFIRINNITAGYSLSPKFLERTKITRLRLYLSAQNPYMWKKFTGFTPELQGPPPEAGIELNIYPPAATYMFGVNVQF